MITRPITRGITSPIARGINAPPGFALNFNAITAALFRNGEQGVAYDLNDLTTLYQDSAGTTPVTAAVQPVGLVLDKSKWLVRGAEIVVNGTFDSGTSGWVIHSGGFTNLTAVDGVAVLTRTGGTVSGVVQTLATAVGKTYELRIRVRKTSGDGSVSVNIVNNAESAFVLNNSVTDAISGAAFVTRKYVFSATEPNNKIYIRTSTGTTNAEFDDVSVRELAGNHAFQPTAASRPMLRQSPILGGELVTNGDFSAGTAGWSVIGSASISAPYGRMVVTDVSPYNGYAVQTISTVAGKTYSVSYATLSAREAYVEVRNATNTANLATTSGYSGTRVGAFSLTFVADGSIATLRVSDASGAAQAAVEVDNISVKEVTGYYTDRNQIDYDQVDDSLGITFPSNLGSNCTVARSIPGVGVQILTAQTIGTSFTDNVDNCGLIIVNRPFTPTETANLTRLFNRLAGV